MTALIGQRVTSPAYTDLMTIERDLARLTKAIHSLAEERKKKEGDACEAIEHLDDTALAALARTILKESAARDSIMPLETFSDPVWHILLDLFASEFEGKQISISSACIGSGVPNTTALRYLKMLHDRAVIERMPDAFDARRQHVRLTPPYKQRMRDHLCMLASSRGTVAIETVARTVTD